MCSRVRLLSPVFTVAVLVTLSALPALAAPPSAKAVRAPGAVKIDGTLDEPGWAQAQWSSDFRSASDKADNAGEPKPMAVQTRFKVLYDSANLYVGVECDEPKPEGLVAQATEHDGNVWGDDCVEVFFDPANEGRYYHHFVVNTKGVWYDEYSADYGLVHGKLWDCALEMAASVQPEAKRWSLEVRIPFGGLQLAGAVGATWLWNITRERYAGGMAELSSWSPLKTNFGQPKLFGKLTDLNVDLKPFAVRLGSPHTSVSGGASGVKEVQVSAPLEEDAGLARRLTGTLGIFGKPETRVKVAGIALATNGKTEVEFPSLKVRAELADAPCLLELRDTATDMLVKSAVVAISAEYRPLALTILRPVYRNCLFASETPKRIEFRVALAEEVRPRIASVRYALETEDGRAVREGKLDAKALSVPCALDATALRDGRYTLVAEALGVDGKALATAQETIRKLPPPSAGNEVRIDEYRRLLVNGKPWLGIGWYGNVPTEDPRADVVALQNVQTPVVVMYPEVTPIREALAKHGVYSVVSVENGRLLYTFELWKQKDSPIPDEMRKLSTPSEEMVGLIRQLLAVVRGEPGVIGYYIADEPEINNNRSDYLEALYRLLVEEDPYHPVIVTNDTLDGMVTHGYKCADILNPDPYSPEFDYVPNFCQRARSVERPGQTTMVTLWHSSGQAHTTADYGTAPPYAYRVFRNQYLSAIAYGAVGFTAYTSCFYMPEVEYRYGLPYVWREVRFLEQAMGAVPPEQELQVESSAEMGRWIREVGSNLYLIVTNHKPGDRTATIRHPLLKKVKQLIVASEGRTVPVRDGAFTDAFKEGEAHIYTTDPTGAALKTTAAVTAELAEREAALAKPGNLLYWKRGTRASASQGYYAPWFDQYYYYAINGITDDLGWYCSHWDGKSAWLELTLKQPARIGRVVIHSPNLANYELQFTGPGGEKCVAKVTGNEKTVIEHNFRPGVPCLKLRLTAFAARAGATPDRPLVSEIEAYEQPGAGEATPVVQTAAAQEAPPIPLQLAGEPSTLWQEDFAKFESAERYNWDGHDTKWVLNPKDLRTQPQPGGGIKVASTSAVGYAGMTHLFPYDPAYRFFQVRLGGVEGEGYRYATIIFGDSSGKPGYRGSINTNRPGVYTVDTYAIHPSYGSGEAKNCFIVLSVAGSGKNPDGTAKPGPQFTFDWVRLARRPVDGLSVTLADGSPLPEELRQGDELLLYLNLAEPAIDATVEAMAGSAYSPLAISAEPYVQLIPAGAKDGHEWAARVKLGPGTGTFDLKANGYPVVFRARASGGKIAETYASAYVSVR